MPTPEGSQVLEAAASRARMVTPHDLSGGEVPITVRLPAEWSPDSKWLLVTEHFYEGRGAAAVNVESGSVHTVEGSIEYSGARSSIAWLPNSTLVHARSLDSAPPLTLWDPASVDPPTRLLSVANLGPTTWDAYGAAAGPDDTAVFVLRGPGRGYMSNGVFAVERDGSHWRRLASLAPDERPDAFTSVAWSAAGEAFVAADNDPEWYPLSHPDYDPPTDGERAFVGIAETGDVWDASELLEGAWWYTWGAPAR
jgi:hypothetical protein